MAKTKITYKTLNIKAGEKCQVSWKGIKEGVFKNQRNGVCFVEFDNGDGSGTRLHRVLTSTVKPMPKAEPKAPKAKKAKAEAPVTKKLSVDALSAEQVIELAKALETLGKLGYEVTELVG